MDFFVNFFVAAVLAGTPILFGIVGEIINEKAGHLNLGVEGMMSIGAVAGFVVGYWTDNLFFALVAAFVAGMLSALIYAVLTVTFMADQNVTGLTLTVFGIGFSNFVGDFVREKSGSTSLKLPENILESLGKVEIPVLTDIPVIGKMFFTPRTVSDRKRSVQRRADGKTASAEIPSRRFFEAPERISLAALA